ncbi:MAG: HAMP domain-containing protein [Thermodesulfobacteriota bacterium]
MKKRSSLERKMLSYFGLIAAASLMITIEFVYAIHGATPEPGVFSDPSRLAADTGRHLIEALDSLERKAVLLFVVQAVVTLIVLIMFMRRITGPLEHMVECSRSIVEGDLSRTVEVRSKDEIGLLGDTINGLTSNLQEIIAFGLSVDAGLREDVEALREGTAGNPDAMARIDAIEEKLDGFRGILQDFTLFPAPLESSEQGAPN